MCILGNSSCCWSIDVVREVSSQLSWIMSLEIYNAIESHMRNQKLWLFDAVDLMVLSASGFQSLPTNIGTETFLGLSHTSTGLHTPHSLPPSISFSFSFHYLFFFTHKHAAKWLFQHSLGGSNNNKKKKTFYDEFIKQFQCDYVNELFFLSMQQCGHLESSYLKKLYMEISTCTVTMCIQIMETDKEEKVADMQL